MLVTFITDIVCLITQRLEGGAMMATTEKLEANKKLARDYIDQVFNQHNPAARRPTS